MHKFNTGELVQIKQNFSLAGYIGIIKSYSLENRTYLIRFNQDLEFSFLEEALERKTV